MPCLRTWRHATQELRHHPRAGDASFTGHAGTNTVVFAGRVSRADKLPPGRYELVIAAVNAAGQRAVAVGLGFTVVG